MTDRFTVSCGIANHTIFIHNVNPLYQGTQPCTDACIRAVRDYMVDDIKKGESSVGYQWKREDGKTVKLVCIVEDEE